MGLPWLHSFTRLFFTFAGEPKPSRSRLGASIRHRTSPYARLKASPFRSLVVRFVAGATCDSVRDKLVRMRCAMGLRHRLPSGLRDPAANTLMFSGREQHSTHINMVASTNLPLFRADIYELTLILPFMY